MKDYNDLWNERDRLNSEFEAKLEQLGEIVKLLEQAYKKLAMMDLEKEADEVNSLIGRLEDER